MGNVREYGLFGSYEPFWGEFHVYRGVGRALVIDETLILVAGVIRVFVLATDAGGAWYPCAGVAIGDEQESSRTCDWGLERTHCRSFVIGRRRRGAGHSATRLGCDRGHVTRSVTHPGTRCRISLFLFYFNIPIFSVERKRSSLEAVVVDALSDRSFAGVRQGGWDVLRAGVSLARLTLGHYTSTA